MPFEYLKLELKRLPVHLISSDIREKFLRVMRQRNCGMVS
jgi:hypothetical protein